MHMDNILACLATFWHTSCNMNRHENECSIEFHLAQHHAGDRLLHGQPVQDADGLLSGGCPRSSTGADACDFDGPPCRTLHFPIEPRGRAGRPLFQNDAYPHCEMGRAGPYCAFFPGLLLRPRVADADGSHLACLPKRLLRPAQARNHPGNRPRRGGGRGQRTALRHIVHRHHRRHGAAVDSLRTAWRSLLGRAGACRGDFVNWNRGLVRHSVDNSPAASRAPIMEDCHGHRLRLPRCTSAPHAFPGRPRRGRVLRPRGTLPASARHLRQERTRHDHQGGRIPVLLRCGRHNRGLLARRALRAQHARRRVRPRRRACDDAWPRRHPAHVITRCLRHSACSRRNWRRTLSRAAQHLPPDRLRRRQAR